MTFVRRARWWLMLVLILPMLGALSIWLNYPVRVTFDFAYRGEPYHVSYVTLMRFRFCRDFGVGCLVEWLPGRATASVALRDGSFVVLSPYWPWSWDKDFGTVRHRAAWVWLDSPAAPSEIVLGDGSEQPDASDHRPFPTLIADATIERVNQLYQIKAFISDSTPLDAGPILTSSRIGLSLNSNGRLFAGIEATPVTLQGSPGIRHSKDWMDLDDGCRIFFRTDRNVEEANNGAAPDWSQTRPLLHSFSKDGDVWSADEKPGPGRGTPSVLYDSRSRGQLANGQAIPDLVRPALDQVHTLKHQGKTCRIPDWPADSFNAYVDFGDGQIFFVATSLEWAIIRD